MFKDIINRLISFPVRGSIKIDLDIKNKVFLLSSPIFSSHQKMPENIKSYVSSREKSFFKPHKTSFKMDGKKVFLIQEIAFSLDSLRKNVDEFRLMSQQCSRMLSEIAIEEIYKDALYLDSHFEE